MMLTATVTPTWSIVIGVLGTLVYIGGAWALRKLKIDDPLEAVSVHGFCGLWGVIAVGNGFDSQKRKQFEGRIDRPATCEEGDFLYKKAKVIQLLRLKM